MSLNKDLFGENESYPLVSVFISSFNHDRYIGEALDSILIQDYENIEIIVVDDSSTDGSAGIIRGYVDRYPGVIKAIYLSENEGVARASNRAFEAAQGKYVALLASDDRMLQGRLSQQVRFLEENPRHVAVFTDVHIIGADGKRTETATANEALFNQRLTNIKRQLLVGNFLNAPSAMLRLADIREIGGYSPLLRYVQDYELWGRLLCRGGIEKLPIRLTEYRVHGSNLSMGDAGSTVPKYSLGYELVSVIVQFTRIWPLEELVDLPLSSEAEYASALLELVEVLKLVDYRYVGKPGLACARAYELALLASTFDPDSSLAVKQSLEKCLAYGFGEQGFPVWSIPNASPSWFIEPLRALGLNNLVEKAACVDSWLAKRSVTAQQEAQIKSYLGGRSSALAFGVVVLDLLGDPKKLEDSLASLAKAQPPSIKINVSVLTISERSLSRGEGSFAFFVKVTINNWLAQLNELVEKSDCDWFLIVAAGEEFTANGLTMAAIELVLAPDCNAVYCDEVYRQGEVSLAAALRPAFNLDYFLSFPAGMARHWFFRREVFLKAGGFDARYPDAFEFELIVRLITAAGVQGLGHISEPLLISDLPPLANVESERQVIIHHLHARGYPNAEVLAPKPGRYCIEYNHFTSPVVTILISAGSRLASLQRCVEGLLGGTNYQSFEVFLIESHPHAKSVHEWLMALADLEDPKLRVILPKSREVATVLNEAVNVAGGDYLLFLAADVAILDGDWLGNMLNHAQRNEVGGVGGLLLTKDGKIAQAMHILGLQGPVGSAYVDERLDTPGYMQRLQVDQNVSALSPDCVMISRELYLKLGGLDDRRMPSVYAMTDLCLRIRQAGYLLVWSPRVQLMIDKKNNPQVTAQQQDAMYSQWLPQLARDPAYNPNFSLAMPGGFKLADTQVSWRPLESWRPLPVVLAHPADTMGCGHYRIIQPFNALREAGVIDGALSVGLMHVVDLERYSPDAVILQRQIGEERLDAMRRMKVFSKAFKVYELDDYLPNLPMKSVHRQHMPKDIIKSLRRGLSFVDRFVVSTDAMAEAFAKLHPSILVVKNRLDPRWWRGLPVSARRASNKPRVGWAGGASHTGDLEMIADVVKELAGEVEWVFFGMCPEKLKPYVHEYHDGVAIESYARKLAYLNLDLALAPVEHNLFNECKSNLRLLEYGACGYPVVCSDVRCYQGDILPVTRVKNRFKDWVDAIRDHINDLDGAARKGDELRDAVLAEWMLEGNNLSAWRKAWLPN